MAYLNPSLSIQYTVWSATVGEGQIRVRRTMQTLSSDFVIKFKDRQPDNQIHATAHAILMYSTSPLT